MYWPTLKARIEYKILLLIVLNRNLEYWEPESNITVRHTSDLNRLSEPRTNCVLGERAFIIIIVSRGFSTKYPTQ